MSNPTDQPLTMSAEREVTIRLVTNNEDPFYENAKSDLLAELDATRAALSLLQSQFDNQRRDKEEGDRQNALILADYRKLREALKDKQRGMTFTESERNAELVRQVAEARERLTQAQLDTDRLDWLNPNFYQLKSILPLNTEWWEVYTDVREWVDDAIERCELPCQQCKGTGDAFPPENPESIECESCKGTGKKPSRAALRAKPEPNALRPTESEASDTTSLQGGKP